MSNSYQAIRNDEQAQKREKNKNTVGCLNTPPPACFGVLVESVGVFAWIIGGRVAALDFDLGLTVATPAPGNTPFKHSSPRLMLSVGSQVVKGCVFAVEGFLNAQQ